METGTSDREVLGLAAATSVAFLVFSVLRLCPTLCLNGDSAELVTAAALWGVPHAPGYPLFTAIGHAFTWLPVHELPWRVHLTSAVFHAGTVGAVTAATFEISRSRVGAVAAALALGLARSFLLGSLYAEVFPLNDFFFAWLLFLALRLEARGGSALPFAVSAGLASAHHMMIALAAPALAVLAVRPLAKEVAGDRRRLATLALGFLLPFVCAYALVPLAAAREPALSWGDVHDARSLLSLVTRRDYGGLFSSVRGAGHGAGTDRLAALGALLAGSFGWGTLAGAAFGAIDLARRRRAIGTSLILGVLVTGPLFAWANALDTSTEEGLAHFERFTTMACIPIAVAFGAGVAAAVSSLAPSRPQRAAGALVLAAWTALAFFRVRAVDLSRDVRGLAFAHDLVLSSPDRSLLLLSGDVPANAALYVCSVERRCGDRVAISPGGLFLPWSMAQTRRRHPDVEIPWPSGPGLKRTHELALAEVGKRPVFVYPDLLEKDPLLDLTFDSLPDHLLFRLWPRGTDAALEQSAFLVSARALLGADGCEGCSLPPPQDHPTQEVQLDHAYEAAALNHARAAGGIPGASALVVPLLQRGGASRSRKSSSSSL